MIAGLVFATALAVAAPVPPAGGSVTGQVTYRIGGSVYVDVGALDGLAAGDTLDVLRGGAPLGRLVAREVAPRRAACDTLVGGAGIAVGDAVRFTPRLRNGGAGADSLADASPGEAPAEASAVRPAPRRARAIRGRWSLSAWSVRPGPQRAFVEPAADLWLDARGLADGSFDAVLDIRGRGIAPVAGSVVAQESFGARVRRAAVTWHDAGSRRSLSLGRQYAPGFASVSLFDGMIARTVGRQLGGGVLFGAQPRIDRLEPSLDLLQAGAFIEAHSPPASPRRWTATLGGVTSWQEGEANRDFLFLQGAWQSRRIALLLAQEVDVARGWRTNLLPGALTPTSTFASARFEITPVIQARVGFDGRRSVPLYRDRATPETEFDDARREGAWLGASARPRPFLRLDADVRRRFGSVLDRMTTWNGGLVLTASGARAVRLRARAARADSDALRTTMFSGSVECEAARGLTLGVGGGARKSIDTRAEFEERTPWWSLEGDFALGRKWSLAGSFEHEDGEAPANLGRLGAAYRF